MIWASRHAWGMVFPFAISTSICRNSVTICSALYLFVDMTGSSSGGFSLISIWTKNPRSRHLADRLLGDPGRATASNRAPKDTDIRKWDLNYLVNVAVDLGYITPGAEKLSHSVRDYRNLVHPGNEIRKKLKFDSEEARIALEVLHIVWRDLSK